MLLLTLMFLGSPSLILLAAAANQCFGADDGGGEHILYRAIRDYISQDCPNNNNCAVGQTYGWPMNSWCVGNVTDMSWLFYEATSFNGNLSSWNTSRVTSMWQMFYGATSFNQDLCAWGDKFPYDNAYVIFLKSGCTFQDTPRENKKGAFCASDCSAGFYYGSVFTVAFSLLLILLGFYQ